MNSGTVKLCPKCGTPMQERNFPEGIGPASASPTLSGGYVYCPECGYAEPVPDTNPE